MYFGEDPEEMKIEGVFQLIMQFNDAFEKCKAGNEKLRLELMKKEEKKTAQHNEKSHRH